VFGEEDWIFSNAHEDAPMGNDGDPAEQTRPWDVDQSGDNGVDPSDLQWALNFQGNTNGRVIGRRYDSATPSALGVALNTAANVRCVVSLATSLPCGRSIDRLHVGDEIELTVSGRVSAGAITTPAQANGIMQFVQDVLLTVPNVLRVVGVEAAAPFVTTRASLQSSMGEQGDQGVASVYGYTARFDQGTTGSRRVRGLG
jgi:hypothetical protein